MFRLKPLICLLGLVFLLTSCSEVSAPELDIVIHGSAGAAGNAEALSVSNEFLELQLIPGTSEVILTEKATGFVWRSNPEGDDPTADAVTKQLLRSQFTVSYADYTGTGMALNNYKYSIEKGLYDYAYQDGGIEVSYTVGDIAREFIIPLAVPEGRLKEFMDKMETAEKRRVEDTYRLYNIEKLRPSDNKDELLAQYPLLEEENIYIIRESVQDFNKEAIEGILRSAGYTEDDWNEDMARFGSASSSGKPAFNVTLRYELDGNSLLVSVPFGKVSYRAAYPITQINLLPFFGAGSTQDEGYLFVPDGSGALINFNNGRHGQLAYNVNMYGFDETLYRGAVVADSRASFPVYGIYKNGGTLACVIEEGSAYSSVRADVSGRNCAYNSVSAAFTMLHSASMDISGKSDRAVLMYENALPEGESIALRFIPCADGYVGMAKTYREYLTNKYGDFKGRGNTDGVPLSVQIIGAALKTRHRLGIPFELPLKLTSYAEAEDMIADFQSMGWRDAVINAAGFFNRSVRHTLPNKIKPIGELGGKRSMVEAAKASADAGYPFYLTADFLFVQSDSPFSGFRVNRDAARYLSRERIRGSIYSPVWFGRYISTDEYMATPSYMMSLMDTFTDKLGDFGVPGVALSNAYLAGDYNEKRFVSREASMNMQSAKLKDMGERGIQTLIPYGNSYAAPFADFIVDLPLSDQSFGITDSSVPFYQIALHSLVPYTGTAVNLAEDYSLNLLKTVEGGAGLYFSFIKENTAVLQETSFTNYFANEYDAWINDADRIYKRFEKDFSGLYSQTIEGHEILADKVTVTVYADGTEVYVNASLSDYDGRVKIPALDYAVVRLEGGK